MVLAKKPQNSVFRNILEQQYDTSVRYKLFKSVKGSLDYVQRMGLYKVLPIHMGCVNCLCWNEKGDKLLSGSDDQHLAITHPYTYKVLTDYKSSHRANIFSAKFLPCTDDTGIVSCSGDGMILYSNVNRLDETRQNIFNCHIGTTYEVATVPDDPNSFLSCGEDCTVRYFDLRIKDKCNKTRCREDILISNRRPVTALCVNPRIPYQLAIGCSDSTVRLYDRRMLSVGGDYCKPYDYFRAPGMDEGRFYRITSLSYSPKGEDILVSYSSEHLYLFSLNNKNSTVFSAQPTSEDMESSCDSGGSSSSSTPVAPARRLRLRGDWSDTGPDARPQNDTMTGGPSNARPTLHGTLMQRMTDVLSRMLNDPATRAALSQGGEDSFPEAEEPQSMQSDPSAQNSEVQEVGSEELSRQNSTDDCPPTSQLEDEERTEETSPIDLPLPSFSSTYSTYVKPKPEGGPPGTGSAEVASQNYDKDDSGPSTSYASTPTTAAKSPPTKVRGHFEELSNEYEDLLHSRRRLVEPMVNLTYSAVGSTASSISLFVDEDSSRTATPKSPEASTSRGSLPQQSSTVEESATDSSDHATRPFVPDMFDNSSVSESEVIDDDYAVSDDDFCATGSPPPPPANAQLRIAQTRKARSSKNKPSSAAGSAAGAMGDDESVKMSRTSGELKFKQKFTGHRNSRTMIKEANFWGDNYVISGSDCGHIFMWERDTAKLVMLLEADNHVVNCVQPHPFLPILASSGIDYNVKLWSPKYEKSTFEVDLADELVKRNAIMLEETRDTITVPASFMIRMLACLNQIRRGGRGRHQQRRESNANSD